MHKYRLVAKKGEGTFSEVLKAQSVTSGEYFAVKCMKNHFRNVEQVNALREIQALRRLSPHDNIIPLVEVLFDSKTGRLALVFELMDQNIYELIRGRTSHVKPKRYQWLMYQLVKAVAHMHRHAIFHRDLKPENILIGSGDRLKVADFGSCRGTYTKAPYTEYISTRWYRAPECLLTNGYYDSAMDMWGIGCVMYEVLALSPLFPGNNETDQIERIHHVLGTPNQQTLEEFKKHSSNVSNLSFAHQEGTGFTPLLPSHTSPELRDLIESLLAYNPAHRLTAPQALRHPFFRDLRLAEKRAKVRTAEGVSRTVSDSKTQDYDQQQQQYSNNNNYLGGGGSHSRTDMTPSPPPPGAGGASQQSQNSGSTIMGVAVIAADQRPPSVYRASIAGLLLDPSSDYSGATSVSVSQNTSHSVTPSVAATGGAHDGSADGIDIEESLSSVSTVAASVIDVEIKHPQAHAAPPVAAVMPVGPRGTHKPERRRKPTLIHDTTNTTALPSLIAGGAVLVDGTSPPVIISPSGTIRRIIPKWSSADSLAEQSLPALHDQHHSHAHYDDDGHYITASSSNTNNSHHRAVPPARARKDGTIARPKQPKVKRRSPLLPTLPPLGDSGRVVGAAAAVSSHQVGGASVVSSSSTTNNRSKAGNGRAMAQSSSVAPLANIVPIFGVHASSTYTAATDHQPNSKSLASAAAALAAAAMVHTDGIIASSTSTRAAPQPPHPLANGPVRVRRGHRGTHPTIASAAVSNSNSSNHSSNASPTQTLSHVTHATSSTLAHRAHHPNTNTTGSHHTMMLNGNDISTSSNSNDYHRLHKQSSTSTTSLRAPAGATLAAMPSTKSRSTEALRGTTTIAAPPVVAR